MLTLAGSPVTPNQSVSRADIDAGLLRFTPDENANGADHASFNFAVNDGKQDSAMVSVNIHVSAVNDAPTAANGSVMMDEDTTYTFAVDDFRFADIDGDSLESIKITRLETMGSLKLNGVDVTLNQVITKANIDASLLKFTPVADANGIAYDNFDFSVSDGAMDSLSSYTMTINVTAIENEPTPPIPIEPPTSSVDEVPNVTSPGGSTSVINSDGTVTITTSNGSKITVTQNSGAIITESGVTLILDANGDGTADVIASSGSTVVANADGTVTVTTNSGSKVTAARNSGAIITESGDVVTIDANGDGTTDVIAPSGSIVVVNADGTLTVTTKNGSKITIEKNANAIVAEDGSVITKGKNSVVDINLVLSELLKVKQVDAMRNEKGDVANIKQQELIGKVQTLAVLGDMESSNKEDVIQLSNIVKSEFKQALDAGASPQKLRDIAVNLVKQSKDDGSDRGAVSKGIVREVIEARELPSTVGQIAASIVNTIITQVDAGEQQKRALKEMVGQIFASELSSVEIVEIFAEMILEVEVNIKSERHVQLF